MTDTQWVSGSAILPLLRSIRDQAAAVDDIDNGVALHTIAARYTSAWVDRAVGGRQALPGAPLKPKLWKRIRRNYEVQEALEHRELKLPAAAGEPRTILRGIEFDERAFRLALVPHGVPPLPPAPVPKQPRQRSGGHNMSAHGAVISAVTIKLLNSPIETVRAHTEATLADVLGDMFREFDAKREHISLPNRMRMARYVLANVLKEMETRSP